MKTICDMVNAFFDDELTQAEFRAFTSHLVDCDQCRATLQDLALLRSAVHQWACDLAALTHTSS